MSQRANLGTCRTQQICEPGLTCSPSHFLPLLSLGFLTMIKSSSSIATTMLSYVGCSLLVLSASLAGASLAEVVFRCPGCTAERLALCPQPTDTCAEIVREPGCGCCPVCARQEGEACGVYTPRCAHGLRCYPTPDSDLPLEQLVQGQGQCRHRVDPETIASSQEQREQSSGQSKFSDATDWNWQNRQRFPLNHFIMSKVWISSQLCQGLEQMSLL